MTNAADFDIVFLALARWDAPYSSTAWSLAKALSKERRVFYIDNPVTITEFARRRTTKEMISRRKKLSTNRQCFNPDPSHPNFFVVIPQFSLPINWMPDGFFYNRFSKLNDRRLSAAINAIVRQHKIERFIFVNSFNPLYGNALSLEVKPQLTVYQSVDDIEQAPYLDKHGPRLEKFQVQNADFTIVTSSRLRDKLSTYTRHVYHLPNAANGSLFGRAMTERFERPDFFSSIPNEKKIITYVGNICQRLDYSLIEKIALCHPDKYVVLVGPHARKPGSQKLYSEAHRIHDLPNVILTGSKDQEELPRILQHSDCCIIPFLCNDLTKSIYPLKINEYLLAGRPVVSTAFSDDIQNFKEVVTIAKNHQQFVKGIGKAIAEDNPSRQTGRYLFSAGNTWEARARTFIELTVEFLKHHDRRTGLLQRRNGKQVVSGKHVE